MEVKPTFLDRDGSEGALRFKVIGPGLIVMVFVIAALSLAGVDLRFAIPIALAAAAAVMWFLLRFADAAGSTLTAFIASSGSFTRPLGDEGRALAELRRLADRYPGSRSAAHARAAIARLKGRRESAG